MAIFLCVCFDNIIVEIKELLTPERKMINEVIAVCKLILVIPATSAAGERSYSTARRLKTWLRSTMTKERFRNLKILNSHKERTERLSLLDIANETLVFLKYLMDSKYQPLCYYFTVLLYFLYTRRLIS